MNIPPFIELAIGIGCLAALVYGIPVVIISILAGWQLAKRDSQWSALFKWLHWHSIFQLLLCTWFFLQGLQPPEPPNDNIVLIFWSPVGHVIQLATYFLLISIVAITGCSIGYLLRQHTKHPH